MIPDGNRLVAALFPYNSPFRIIRLAHYTAIYEMIPDGIEGRGLLVVEEGG